MSAQTRKHTHRYIDPISQIWINCAARIGFEVVRTEQAYAYSNGQGRIFIGTDSELDPDDNLAQMILHELCHALIEGEEGEKKADWGLDNTRMGYPWREHACLRLQAWIADTVGLRGFLAPTTDFRESFYNKLLSDPFYASPDMGGRQERSCVAARVGVWRSKQSRFYIPLNEALATTAHIAELVQLSEPAFTESVTRYELPSLWETTRPPYKRHPMGLAMEHPQNYSCNDCAWISTQGQISRCKHNPKQRIPDSAKACAFFEPERELNCQTCGACCREAFDSVEIGRRDPFTKLHPELILTRDTHLKLKRSNKRCEALSGNGREDPFSCMVYQTRPKTCRDFTKGSKNCLGARQRVGLSL